MKSTIKPKEKIAAILKSYGGNQIAQKDIASMLKKIAITLGNTEPYACYDINNYARNCLYRDKYCEVVLIGWLAGQKSAVHDHTMSNCAFMIIKGNAIEQFFIKNVQGKLEAINKQVLVPGNVSVAESNTIHQVSNQTQDENLLTLHLYSSPIKSMSVYGDHDYACVLQ